MARVCEICGRGPQFGHRISHAHNVTKRRWQLNLQPVQGDGQRRVEAACASALPASAAVKSKKQPKRASRFAGLSMLDLRVPSGLFFCLVGLLLLLARHSRAGAHQHQCEPVRRPRDAACSAPRCCYWRGETRDVSRVSRARASQSHRRTHRLQPGLRSADCARPGDDSRFALLARRAAADVQRTIRRAADWAPGELPSLDSRSRLDRLRRRCRARADSEGFPIAPLEIRIESTVPEGSGLSSSAALEVSSALAMLDGRPIDKLLLAQICQRAERNFVGMPSGVMDQYIAVFGQEQAALQIDCRSLTHRVVALPPEVEIFAVNSMVKHALAQSAYRERTCECEAAVAAIAAGSRRSRSLRDASEEMLATGGSTRRKARPPGAAHRQREPARGRVRGRLPRAGICAGWVSCSSPRTHSLRDDYEVSCPELDFLVDAACSIEGVYGARMTGGGFGGCTVNLVDPAAARRLP